MSATTDPATSVESRDSVRRRRAARPRGGRQLDSTALIYLVPPLASVQAAIIFGEELTLPMILGTLVVIAGVYLANRKQRQAAPAE